MEPELEPALRAFVDASNGRDTDAYVRCFTADAVVEDEGGEHRGPDAIRAWREDTVARYDYTLTPLAVEAGDGATVLVARIAGTFDGSPITLRHQVTLDGDRIAALRISS